MFKNETSAKTSNCVYKLHLTIKIKRWLKFQADK